MELLKLIGVVVVIIGFALKFDTIATVVAAGIITGLVAVANGSMTFIGIFDTLGKSFVSQRTATLLVLTIGVIGICERNGLKDKAVDFIRKLEKATTGVVLSVWEVIRTFSAAFSLRLGGHVQFIRPIIAPMAEGAAIAKYGEVDEKSEDEIKGAAAAVENYGNFFGQCCFMGSSGTLLIVSTLNELGADPSAAATALQNVDALKIAMACWPICLISMVVGVISNLVFDKRLAKRLANKAK